MKRITLLLLLIPGLRIQIQAQTNSQVFAPDSFWYQAIPQDAPLHPNTTNFAAEFLRQRNAYYGTVSINTTAYSCPIYVVGPEVKPVEVSEWEWDCQKKSFKDPHLAAQWRAVPIPVYAAPADGTDAEMWVHPRSLYLEWCKDRSLRMKKFSSWKP